MNRCETVSLKLYLRECVKAIAWGFKEFPKRKRKNQIFCNPFNKYNKLSDENILWLKGTSILISPPIPVTCQIRLWNEN